MDTQITPSGDPAPALQDRKSEPIMVFKFNIENAVRFAKQQVAICDYIITTTEDEDKRAKNIQIREDWQKFITQNS